MKGWSLAAIVLLIPLTIGGRLSWVRLARGVPRGVAFGTRLLVIGFVVGMAVGRLGTVTNSRALQQVSFTYMCVAPLVGLVVALIAAKIWKLQDVLDTSPIGVLITGTAAALFVFAGLGKLLTVWTRDRGIEIPAGFGIGVATGVAGMLLLGSVLWAVRVQRRGNYRLAPLERFAAASD